MSRENQARLFHSLLKTFSQKISFLNFFEKKNSVKIKPGKINTIQENFNEFSRFSV